MKQRHVQRLIQDRSGNFGIMTAILLPVMLGAVGIAIDVSNMMLSKRALQEAIDAASLAAATAMAQDSTMTEDTAEALAIDYLKGQMSNVVSGETLDEIVDSATATVTTTTTSSGKRYDIQVSANYEMALTPFMNVFGMNSAAIGSSGSTTSGVSETKSALSMSLVLDESGSMLANTGTQITPKTSCQQYNSSGSSIGVKSPCYIKKIDALKTAANLLLDQLDAADPQGKYVRTNAIAWSSKVIDSSSFAWGTATTRSDVINTMSATGGTESAAAMKKAYQGLTTTGAKSESSIHSLAGNTKLTKYIVLMTDGSNNATSSDTSTLATCTTAKAEGIIIYSIAFMAPTAGQNLLSKCSSGTGYYYQAESMNDLLQAFKAIGEEASANKTLLTQ